MFKGFVYLGLLLQFSKEPNILAFQPITEPNHVLVDHVFQQLFGRDWFNCIQACHDEPRCISYNYQRSVGANGLCELNDYGVEDLCDRSKSLIYSLGFVFQQIRQSEVSTVSIPSIASSRRSLRLAAEVYMWPWSVILYGLFILFKFYIFNAAWIYFVMSSIR